MPSDAHIETALAGLHAGFEANAGQAGPGVDFVARLGGYTASLDRGDAVVSLSGKGTEGKRSAVRMGAVGAAHPVGEGLDRQAGVRNYLVGNDPDGWHTGVATYGKVRYPGIYPGIDLVYHARPAGLEYDWVVAPGADPAAIVLAFEGAERLSLDREGNLVLSTPAGDVRHHRPVLYQDVDGRRRRVDGGFVRAGDDRVRFRVGPYDHRRTLVIDPVVTTMLFGGGAADAATSIAVDAEGKVVVAGTTESLDLNPVPNPNFPPRGGGDAFVARLTPTASGFTMNWITYLAGEGADEARAVATIETDAVVVGRTNSLDFPLNPNRFTGGAGHGGGTCGDPPSPCSDGFVAQLDPTGTLKMSRYLGTPQAEAATAVAVEPGGDIYVAGTRTNNPPPHTGSTLAGASLTGYTPRQYGSGGGIDAFIVKLGGTADTLETYVGGSGDEVATGIALRRVADATGVATYLPTVVGTTSSADFPTMTPWQAAPGGGQDGFVATLDAGFALASSSYLGGSGADAARAVTVDAAGAAYVAGETASTDFPAGGTHLDIGPRGGADAFVVKVAPGGSDSHSARIGGAQRDAAAGIALDAAGNLHLAGETFSTDFPILDFAASQESYGGAGDAFAARLNFTATTVEPVYSTFIDPAPRATFGAAAAVAGGPDGTAYVAGSKTLASGDGNALLVRVTPPPLPPVDTTPPETAITAGPRTTRRATVTFEFSATEAGSSFSCSLDGAPSAPCSSPHTHSSLALGQHRFTVAATDSAGNTDPTPAEWAWEVTARPNGGMWSDGEPLSAPHVFHTATLLDGPTCRAAGAAPAFCGKVLVAGGNGPSELYDPMTGVWTPTGALVHPRAGHGAVLLDGAACRRPAPVAPPTTTTTTLLPPTTLQPSTTTTAPPPPPEPCGKVLVAGGQKVRSNVDYEGGGAGPLELYDPVAGTWTALRSTGSGVRMTATVLDGPACTASVASESPCGKVLLAGGSYSGAQLFDPATTAVASLPSMNGVRSGHTAHLLDGPACPTGQPATWCGKVLVQGGSEAGRPDEVYDPAANAWTPTGNKAGAGVANLQSPAARLDGPACRRPDPADYCGKVLALIGNDVAAAALYDPATMAWTATGPPLTRHYSGRDAGRAVLIDGPACMHDPAPANCGKVLVTGGQTAWPAADQSVPDVPAESAAELYDPASGTWTLVESLATGRFMHTVTSLATGEILVAGGRSRGFNHPVDAVGSVELFDPSLPGDPPGPGVLQPRSGPAAGGTTLVIGGLGLDAVSGVEIDGASVPFTVESPTRLRASTPGHPAGEVEVTLKSLHDGIAIAVPAGRFNYVEADAVPAPTVVRLDAAAGPTKPGGAVRISGSGFVYSATATTVTFGERAASDVKVIADTVLLATPPPSAQGDVPVRVTTPRGASGDTTESRFTYGPTAWSATPALTSCAEPASCSARERHTATALNDGRVLVTGGETRGCGDARRTSLASAQVYDPARGLWLPTASMHEGRSGHTATLLDDGRVLVAGGGLLRNGACRGLATSEIYDPATGTWTATTGAMPSGRYAHTATRLADGKVLVAGGAVFEGNPRPSTAAAAVFDPASGTWKEVGNMVRSRESHTATLLPDGSVLVAGGLDDRSAERYDPATEKWAITGELAEARFGHTATLINGPPCRSAAPPARCGRVLVAGGVVATNGPVGTVVYTVASELYDPAKGTWGAAGPMEEARGGHSAAVLEDGRVLVAGAGMPVLDGGQGTNRALRSAEVYDPVAGRWSMATPMREARGLSTATLLDGAACDAGDRPAWCGDVLIAGGAASGNGHFPPPMAGAELFRPAPEVTSVEPVQGPAGGGTAVTVTGSGFGPASAVTFGGLPSASVVVESPERLTAVAPAHAKGPVHIAVADEAGTSARLVPRAATRFLYVDGVGVVTDLAATARSETEVLVSFTAPDDGTTLASATEFVVKQSPSTITTANFDAATSLCDQGRCQFSAGTKVELAVTDLTPATTYHYAVKAIGANGEAGPVSVDVAVTTPPVLPAPTTCPAAPDAGTGRVAYPGGRYSLIGLPGGTLVPTRIPLYGWFNQGAGASYAVSQADVAVSGGRGYWAWFACPVMVDVGGGAPSADFPLVAYHASMVGNPSGRAPAVVSGHDYAARWDAALNDGAGGYRLSGYREPQELAVGEGMWTFSFVGARLSVTER